MEKKEIVTHLKEKNKMLEEELYKSLQREKRVRNDILFSLVISLIVIVVLFILSFSNK
ncbi:MAG: hypothetical protein PHE21_00110 [Candidatus Dojkabacteria bacterium]|nr:hypothetical protein [Candidatus Dojkabacteria bacterium]